MQCYSSLYRRRDNELPLKPKIGLVGWESASSPGLQRLDSNRQSSHMPLVFDALSTGLTRSSISNPIALTNALILGLAPPPHPPLFLLPLLYSALLVEPPS